MEEDKKEDKKEGEEEEEKKEDDLEVKEESDKVDAKPLTRTITEEHWEYEV
jgi:hypothetical protein